MKRPRLPPKRVIRLCSLSGSETSSRGSKIHSTFSSTFSKITSCPAISLPGADAQLDRRQTTSNRFSGSHEGFACIQAIRARFAPGLNCRPAVEQRSPCIGRLPTICWRSSHPCKGRLNRNRLSARCSGPLLTHDLGTPHCPRIDHCHPCRQPDASRPGLKYAERKSETH